MLKAEVFSDDLRERLAAVQHRIWVHWMRYLYSCCRECTNGDLAIPPEFVNRWRNLMKLDYGKLSSVERLSDQDMADWVLEELGTIRGARVVLEVGEYSIPSTLESMEDTTNLVDVELQDDMSIIHHRKGDLR